MYIYTIIVAIMYMYCVIDGVMWVVFEKKIGKTDHFFFFFFLMLALIGASAPIIALLSFG